MTIVPLWTKIYFVYLRTKLLGRIFILNRFEEYNRTWKNINQIYSKYARKKGISESKLLILYSLYLTGEALQSDLCLSLLMPKQTVSAVLNSLKKDGLIDIEFAEKSRKSKKILLTAKGALKCKKLIEPLAAAETDALNSADESDIVSMAALYDKIEARLNKLL